MTTVNVKKSDGSLEPLNLNKIIRWSEWATSGCPDISLEAILTSSSMVYYDGISTYDITEAIAKNCETLAVIESMEENFTLAQQYLDVARNLYIPCVIKKANRWQDIQLNKEDVYTSEGIILSDTNIIPLPRFKTKALIALGIKENVYDSELLDGSLSDDFFAFVDESIDYSRTNLLWFGGLKQLEAKYISKIGKQTIEDPQQHFAHLSLALVHADAKVYPNGKDLESQKIRFTEYYDTFSQAEGNNPTPFSHSIRTNHKQYDSCTLFELGDTIPQIRAGMDVATAATVAGAGIGVSLGAIRAKGTRYKSKGVHGGLGPYLTALSASIKSSNQETRGGSATVNYPIWHRDVYELLMAKDNTSGVEGENRWRHLDYAVHYSNDLLNRLPKNEKILLVSPHEKTKSGKTIYQAFYNTDENGKYDPSAFLEYEAAMLARDDLFYINSSNIETAPAGIPVYTRAYDLFSLLVSQIMSTGRIYTFNTTHANSHSAYLEPIKMSNLCVSSDTLLLTSEGYKTIKGLKGQEVEVWNGEQWSKTTVVQTGVDQELLEVVIATTETKDTPRTGIFETLKVTQYHKWYDKEGKELRTFELSVGTELEEWVHPTSKRIVYSTIESIKKVERDDTYCVTEPLRNRVVFNGVLTGNCLEITQPTSPISYDYNSKDHTMELNDGEVSFCQLGAIVLGKTKFEDIPRVTRTLLRTQEAVFNISDYSSIPFSHKQKKRRNVGIGVVNLHHMLTKEVYSVYPEKDWYQKTGEICHKYFEAIQYYLLDASAEMAKDLGPCELYHLTKYSKGILPIDTCTNTINNNYPLLQDWEALRAKIKKYGLRYSVVSASMPVESSSVPFGLISGKEMPRTPITFKGNKVLSVAVAVPEMATLGAHYIYAWDKKKIDKNKLNLIIESNHTKFQDQASSWNQYWDLTVRDKIPELELFDTLLMAPAREGVKTMYYNNFNTDKDVSESEDKVEQLKKAALAEADDGCSSGMCKI